MCFTLYDASHPRCTVAASDFAAKSHLKITCDDPGGLPGWATMDSCKAAVAYEAGPVGPSSLSNASKHPVVGRCRCYRYACDGRVGADGAFGGLTALMRPRSLYCQQRISDIDG